MSLAATSVSANLFPQQKNPPRQPQHKSQHRQPQRKNQPQQPQRRQQLQSTWNVFTTINVRTLVSSAAAAAQIKTLVCPNCRMEKCVRRQGATLMFVAIVKVTCLVNWLSITPAVVVILKRMFAIVNQEILKIMAARMNSIALCVSAKVLQQPPPLLRQQQHQGRAARILNASVEKLVLLVGI